MGVGNNNRIQATGITITQATGITITQTTGITITNSNNNGLSNHIIMQIIHHSNNRMGMDNKINCHLSWEKLIFNNLTNLHSQKTQDYHIHKVHRWRLKTTKRKMEMILLFRVI